MFVTASSARSLQAKLGLPLVNQVVGWIVLGMLDPLHLSRIFLITHLFFLAVLSTLTPFVTPVKHANPDSKILMYFMGFGTCFVLLSISVEGLFYVAYTATLGVWVEVEAALRSTSGGKSASSSAGKLSSFGADKTSPSGAGRTSSSDAPSAKPDEATKGQSSFVVDDLRIALFFLFFVQVGFFGTGK